MYAKRVDNNIVTVVCRDLKWDLSAAATDVFPRKTTFSHSSLRTPGNHSTNCSRINRIIIIHRGPVLLVCTTPPCRSLHFSNTSINASTRNILWYGSYASAPDCRGLIESRHGRRKSIRRVKDSGGYLRYHYADEKIKNNK